MLQISTLIKIKLIILSFQVNSGRLYKVFKEGQSLVCKVTDVKTDNQQKILVKVTIDPTEVNSELSIRSINKGSLLTVAVKSLEDHGYMLETGLPNATSFLPFHDASGYRQKFYNGKHLRMSILF